MKKSLNPETIHKPVAPYVHQIEVTGPNKWLTMSGQIGMDIAGNIPDDPLEQLQLALDNVRKNLVAANMTVSDLTKLVFYLVGDFDAEKRREIIGNFVGENLPCTTMMYVVGLAAPALKVEVDAWACQELK
ncbi:RidA family protein [Niallia taxi]|uniref:RidA family protein n=1 Tax=Niallia taxi TaxID=2499688 RepID=UPI002E2437CC|nr:Rid family hydrolase [Niallia taxi]